MGKGKKNRPKQSANNQQLLQNPQTPLLSMQPQEMSSRNLVQEENFASGDEKNNGKSTMVDTHGSDSEEDNAAAGGGLVNGDSDTKVKKALPQISDTNIHKKKNKEAKTKLNTSMVAGRGPTTSAVPLHVPDRTPPNNIHAASRDEALMDCEHLGRIVMRLLPAEHQAERLPDGRYIMTAAAVGYLAQKLGH